MNWQKNVFRLVALGFCVFVGSGCAPKPGTPVASAPSNRVVLFCSVDDVYARPIIRDLEKRTGLKIDALYDTEAAKTAGLANKIRAEKSRPQGDVFWNSALLQTLLLKREGLLQPYVSPSAKDIPTAFKAKDGSWTGLGVRARVGVWAGIEREQGILNMGDIPTSVESLAYFEGVGISNPQFGTASDWVAALTARWKKERTLRYFRNLKQRKVRVLPGNSVVAQKVSRHELLFGVTDSDDYASQKNLSLLSGSLTSTSTVFIPGSVAILKNSPHEANAKMLVDALLQVETERQLVNTMIGVIPTRPGIEVKQLELKMLAKRLKNAPNDTDKWPAAWDAIREPLAELLLKD